MPDIDVLLTDPQLPRAPEILTSAFTLHSVHEPGEIAELPDRVVNRIRGIACGAHIPFDGALMDRFPNLEIIANFGVGYDTIDAGEAARRGVIVTNTPDVLTEEVADTAIGLLIMTARELSAAERWLRAGNWKTSYPLSPGTLRNRTLGIFGLGRIGKAIARRAEAMGLPILYHNRRADPQSPYGYCSSLLELAQRSDILLSVAPAGPTTDGVVDAAVFRALGSRGIFINIGPRLGRRRDGAGRGSPKQNDPVGRPRRVCTRAPRTAGTDRHGSRGAAAACRLGLDRDPRCHGSASGRQSRQLVSRGCATDARC